MTNDPFLLLSMAEMCVNESKGWHSEDIVVLPGRRRTRAIKTNYPPNDKNKTKCRANCSFHELIRENVQRP
jgi:hypothetical protein